MMGDTIKEGYKITVSDKEGTVCDVIELGGYNLSLDKPMARSSLVNDIVEALPSEAFDPPNENPSNPKEKIGETATELRKLSNRLEVALAEGDNPVSAKCAVVLDSPIKCYDFSGSRRFAACRAWQLMEELKISWQEAITKAWEEIKSRCTWD